MKTNNLPSGTLRTGEAGLVWEEQLTNESGSVEMLPYQTFRVRATVDGTTVTIENVLSMTMGAGEIAIFNAGKPDPSDPNSTCTVTVNQPVYLQWAREVDKSKY